MPVEIDLSTSALDPVAIACIPAELAHRWNILPIRFHDGALELAAASPLNLDALDALAQLSGRPIACLHEDPAALHLAIAKHYGPAAPGVQSASESADESVSKSPTPGLPDSIIPTVESILHEAVRRRASDIHFEPLAKRFRVRYRIDGALIEVESPPPALQLPIISRLKIMAQMSIAEKRLPQDGRIKFAYDGRVVDLRAASIPTVNGESMVLRLLEAPATSATFDDLGLCDQQRGSFAALLSAPDGMILVTGPTGCGKSTTLYRCLQRLNESSRKVITVEDPIELQIRGITQVPVREEVGMTFASALRAMLRQAPNVIMVGEIRDRETAEIALNASLTGHLVLSTLHTNDAPSAIARLLDLGAKPFLVAAALRGIIAQRLVRKICGCSRIGGTENGMTEDGGTADRATEGRATAAAPSSENPTTVMLSSVPPSSVARGCPACLGTRFHGRLPIFEMFLISDAVRQLIHQGTGATRIRAQARQDGMRSLREDGIRKVLAGLTTIDEVLSTTLDDSDHPQPNSMS